MTDKPTKAHIRDHYTTVTSHTTTLQYAGTLTKLNTLTQLPRTNTYAHTDKHNSRIHITLSDTHTHTQR